ncbi:MAG: 2,3-bisphosphoglycerate-dependent phosphoglycerate mutase [Pseudomonadota bacterium]
MTHAPWMVLLRHGHSEWNLSDRFTGWTDIPLTGVGLAEAADAGRRLADAGYAFDAVHGSVLMRTCQTADAVLAAMGAADLPRHATWRLNERHYGALQGLNKQEIFRTWGEAASRRWWRGYVEPPPALDWDDPRHPRFDARYLGIDPRTLPVGESLRDCRQRMLPYWRSMLQPALRAGQGLLVISHGNTLRGLVMELDGLDADAMEKVEIASGVPLVYRFNPDGSVAGRDWLETASVEPAGWLRRLPDPAPAPGA